MYDDLKPLDTPERSAPLSSFLQSSLGKKVLTGATGLGMVAFIVIHLLGNLLLLVSRDRFNQYAAVLEQMKPLVILVEVILVIFVAIHALLGIQLFWRKRAARPEAYAEYQSAGEPSHQTWSSRHMIWTGLSLAVFLIWHLLTFKWGARYTTMLGGGAVRDLAQLVIESFQQLWFTVSYGAIVGDFVSSSPSWFMECVAIDGTSFPQSLSWSLPVV